MPTMDGGGNLPTQDISADEPDWSRERVTAFWQPGRQLLRTIRGYQRSIASNTLASRLRAKLYVIEHRFWSAVSGADIPLNSQIGGGLLLPHPNGVVIHPHASIGVNCAIFQQATIGTRRGGGVPTLDGHVDVGPGARILGSVHIPAHTEVPANAVVTRWPLVNR